MDNAVISRAEIIRRAHRDYAEGKRLSECVYHPWAAAYKTHAGVYRRLNNAARIAARQRNEQFVER